MTPSLGVQRRRFRNGALVYSLAYAVIVAADHVTTLMLEGHGGTEANPLFRSGSGALSDSRALVVFVLLWPVLVSLLHLSWRRAVGGARVPSALEQALIGASPTAAALLPMVVLVSKSFIAFLNLLDVVTPLASLSRLRDVLAVLGVKDPSVAFYLSGVAVLVLALPLARMMARAWVLYLTRAS